MAMDLRTLLQGLTNTDPDASTGPSTVSPISVQAAPRQAPPDTSVPAAPVDRSIYNNLPEVQAAQHAQQQYPQHTGMFGVKGTLRDILGLVGDAMLVQSGHDPVYSARRQQEREADAMAGFQNDPRAAAGRVGAVVGGIPDALKLFGEANTQELKKAQLQSVDQYRQEREDALKDQREARMRQAVGGILSAAAKPDPTTGKTDPQKWARARAMAIKLGSKIGDWDDSEAPENPEEYTGGYGMTAQQVARKEVSEESIAERGHSADVAHKDRVSDPRRVAPQPHNPVNPTAAALAAPLLNKLQNGGTLTAGEEAVLDRLGMGANRGKPKGVVMPPGLKPAGGNNAPSTKSTGKMVVRNGQLVQQ